MDGKFMFQFQICCFSVSVMSSSSFMRDFGVVTIEWMALLNASVRIVA